MIGDRDLFKKTEALKPSQLQFRVLDILEQDKMHLGILQRKQKVRNDLLECLKTTVASVYTHFLLTTILKVDN